MLYCRIQDEKLTHLVVIGATHVAWQGQPILVAAKPSGFFEWRRRDAMMNAKPGDFSVTPRFEELTGGVGSSPANLSSYVEKH